MKYTIIKTAPNASIEFVTEDYVKNFVEQHSPAYQQTHLIAVVINPDKIVNTCADNYTGFVYGVADTQEVGDIEHEAWDAAWENYNSYCAGEWEAHYNGPEDGEDLNDLFVRDAKYVADNYVIIDFDFSE